MVDPEKRAARQRRQDAKRPAPVPVRLDGWQLDWLDAQCAPGEGRSTAIKRLAGVPVKPDPE